MLLRALLGAVTAVGLWAILPATAGAQPVEPTTTSPPVTTAPPTTAPPATAAPATTARPPTPSSRPATTRPATTAPRPQVRGEATSSLPAAPGGLAAGPDGADGAGVVVGVAGPAAPLGPLPAGGEPLPDHHLGGGAGLPGGPGRARALPAHLVPGTPRRDHHRPRRRGRRGDRAAGALRPGRPADPGAALRARGEAVGPRRRDPGRPLRRGRARRLRHRLAARAAGRGPDALRRPHGRRGRAPPERLPARLQHLAAGRGLAGQRPLPRLPAGPEPGRGVACLSGRTAACRRALLLPLLPGLEQEVFMGRECVAGDDGRLTWLILSTGFRTVYQSNARAVSMFPNSLRAFFKQRVRWSRNSYRCYLTSIAKGWLWRQPFITQVTVLQVLLTPFSMATALVAVWFALR